MKPALRHPNLQIPSFHLSNWGTRSCPYNISSVSCARYCHFRKAEAHRQLKIFKCELCRLSPNAQHRRKNLLFRSPQSRLPGCCRIVHEGLAGIPVQWNQFHIQFFSQQNRKTEHLNRNLTEENSAVRHPILFVFLVSTSWAFLVASQKCTNTTLNSQSNVPQRLLVHPVK